MSREFLYQLEDMMETSIVFGGLGPTLSMVAYVFSALAIYNIAQRRGISKPWLAWIPVVNVWILGSLSDQYRYVTRGEVKSKRKVLLTLGILNTILSAAAVIRVIVLVVNVFTGSMQGVGENALGRMLMEGVLTSLAISLPLLVLSIVGMVFEYMALYDVYSSCEPVNAVLYLVLSIIPGLNQITKPLFLFLCRNKDEGMPPRMEEPAPFTEYTEL